MTYQTLLATRSCKEKIVFIISNMFLQFLRKKASSHSRKTTCVSYRKSETKFVIVTKRTRTRNFTRLFLSLSTSFICSFNTFRCMSIVLLYFYSISGKRKMPNMVCLCLGFTYKTNINDHMLMDPLIYEERRKKNNCSVCEQGRKKNVWASSGVFGLKKEAHNMNVCNKEMRGVPRR